MELISEGNRLCCAKETDEVSGFVSDVTASSQTGKKYVHSSLQCNNVTQYALYCVSFSKLEMWHSTQIPTTKFTDNYLLDGIISTTNE